MALDLERRTITAVKLDTSSTNVPTGFDKTTSGSLILQNIANAQAVAIVNGTSGRIAVNITGGDPTTNPTSVDMYVWGKGSGDFVASVKDKLKLNGCIYIKSDTGAALSSGIITVEVW